MREDPRAQPNFAPPVPVKLLNPSFEYLPTFPAPKFIRRDVLFLSLPSRINEKHQHTDNIHDFAS